LKLIGKDSMTGVLFIMHATKVTTISLNFYALIKQILMPLLSTIEVDFTLQL